MIQLEFGILIDGCIKITLQRSTLHAYMLRFAIFAINQEVIG